MAVRDAIRATKALAITKSDVTTYDPPLQALYVGGSGDIAILAKNDSTPVTLTAVPVGLSIQGIEIVKVMDTNTDATDMIGFS